jgi:membrane fusion protein (multidrug efflux system)
MIIRVRCLAARLRGVAAMAVALGLLVGCKPSQGAAPAAPPAPHVSVVTMHAKPVSLTSDLPGRTTAFGTAAIEPQVTGVVLKRLFTEGDDVTAGQVLYQIDPASYQAQVDSEKAAVEKARAVVVSERLTVGRDRPLVRAQAVAQETLDNDVATLLQNEADVASARAALETASINLGYTKVTAPIAGRTGRSSVTAGALVTADQTTALATVTQINPIYVDVTQPSTTLLRLKRELKSGQLKTAGTNQAEVHLILEDGSDYPQVGRLQFSEVSVDEDTGTVTLRAIFPNDDGLLLPGMFVRERIQEGISADGILAPQQAVTHNPQGQPTALIVDKDNKVQLRVLVADRAIGTNWLVTKGLVEGDRVIVAGVQMVKPGMVVVPQEQTAAPAADQSAAAN